MSAETGPSVQRVCVRCGRVGVQQYISARPDGTHAVTGEAWVCANERACRRRVVSRPRPARNEATPAIVRAERALVEKWHGTFGRAFHPSRIEEATAAVSAALPTECHEAVVPEWADGEEMPCNSTRVVGFRTDNEGLYPVCADHVREPMVSLRTALLGADS